MTDEIRPKTNHMEGWETASPWSVTVMALQKAHEAHALSVDSGDPPYFVFSCLQISTYTSCT